MEIGHGFSRLGDENRVRDASDKLRFQSKLVEPSGTTHAASSSSVHGLRASCGHWLQKQRLQSEEPGIQIDCDPSSSSKEVSIRVPFSFIFFAVGYFSRGPLLQKKVKGHLAGGPRIAILRSVARLTSPPINIASKLGSQQLPA